MSKTNTRYSILIFEDDIDLAQQWVATFKENDADAIFTDNFSTALYLCSQNRFDAIVCDIYIRDATGQALPDNGAKLIGLLRTPALRDLPEWYSTVAKIAVTGSRAVPGFDILDSVQKMGCVGSLRKPFEPKELVETVFKCIEAQKNLESL